MHRLARVSFLFLFVATPLFAHAASRVECNHFHSRLLRRNVPYCVVLPSSYDTDKTRRYPVVYYLHGLGDNEQSLVNLGGWQIYDDLFRQKKIGEFLMIAPNGYSSFFINSRDGKFAYKDFFFKEFLPEMEKKYRVKAERSSRGIMGISMGGYGAMNYAFSHPQMFAAVSTHMAALRDGGPPDLDGTREGRILANVFGKPVDAAFYKKNSPFTLVRNLPVATLRRMAIYFDCGTSDNYGFDQGARDMDKLLTARGVKHEFHLYPGRHDWQFVLDHFAASLEFQSKALHATP